MTKSTAKQVQMYKEVAKILKCSPGLALRTIALRTIAIILAMKNNDEGLYKKIFNRLLRYLKTTSKYSKISTNI